MKTHLGRLGDVRTAVLAAILAVAATGCARRLDLAKVPSPDAPALTIPYTGVREETRLYPDYGSIGASILTEEPSHDGAASGPKPRAPSGPVGKPTKKGKAP